MTPRLEDRIAARRIDEFAKRALDIGAAVVGLGCLGWLILVAAAFARSDTRASGFFHQQRIGRHGRLFWLHKIRTMRIDPQNTISATAAGDPRITRLGRWLRRTKIDELPQLWNVLRGEMSLVGPRPEVPAYLSVIRASAPEVLAVKPGITGPATLLFRDEELLLDQAENPQVTNDRLLYPLKLRLNSDYANSYTLQQDLQYLWFTLTGRGPRLRGLDQLPTEEFSNEQQRQAA